MLLKENCYLNISNKYTYTPICLVGITGLKEGINVVLQLWTILVNTAHEEMSSFSILKRCKI